MDPNIRETPEQIKETIWNKTSILIRGQVKFKFPSSSWELTFSLADRAMYVGNWHLGWQIKIWVLDKSHPGRQVKTWILDKASPLPQLNTPTNGNRISVQQRHVPKEIPYP